MKSSRLTITTEGFATFVYDIIDHCVKVGRDKANDIVVPDSKVSREHCRFELLNGVVILYDCGSKNGMFINGIQQEKVRLLDGDRIRIGNSILKIAITGGAGAKELDEKTIEFDTLGHVTFPDEQTQGSILHPVTGEGGETLPPALLPLGRSSRQAPSYKNVGHSIKESKIYVLAGILLVVGIGMFLYGKYNESQDKLRTVLTSTVIEAKVKKSTKQQVMAVEPDETKQDSEPKNRKQATQLAREADTLSDLGKHVQAITLYHKALELDPENGLAKTNLALLNAQMENLARNCFDNGLHAYKFSDYGSAINQWEQVLFLLENRKEHKMYQKTARFLEQAKMKVHK